jgi:hypothetical protein
MNATQTYMTNLGYGPTDAQVLAARQSPPAIQPTDDRVLETDASFKVKWEENGRPQTILPHPPQEYVWH